MLKQMSPAILLTVVYALHGAGAGAGGPAWAVLSTYDNLFSYLHTAVAWSTQGKHEFNFA